MRVRSLRMFVREFAMFLSSHSMVLGLFVLAACVVMFSLMVVMGRSVVVASRCVVMLARRMFCHFAVLPRSDLGRTMFNRPPFPGRPGMAVRSQLDHPCNGPLRRFKRSGIDTSFSITERTIMTTNGKTVLITGSTDGVGRYVAERLAARGWRVVHGRDRARGEAVVERIAQQGGKARFLVADLASLAEVRSLADAVRRDGDGLDAIVNNAGIGASGARRELSADGFELRFAVNYLAGFLLTRLLLPMLTSQNSARIVNASSAGQQAIDFSDVMLTRGYSGVRAYCQSKLAQILFTADLAKELAGQNIAVNCLHPATYMDTTMVRLSGVRPISTVEQGGAAILQLVDEPALASRSGLYFSGMQESRAGAAPAAGRNRRAQG